ncbi:nitroreductase family protein [Emericellopsis atlantica]|uniref:Nitroreductase family protein n=1 Tax=Emericellopsis atlantica TaxID=2614577 RepID=A0A9P7ZE96_9HYPO|nr:nitroreductase family protein [Emericellopsis atlantica]KAG9250405.1 nitroreductase family protein [Emericellopsis atlantica]
MSKVSADALIQLAKQRRTIYPLTKNLPISTARVQEIVNELTLHTPSSFNSQSNRVVVLFGAEHEKLWDFATQRLKAIVPEENWKPTGDKMAMFRAAAGTVLFFSDNTTVNEYKGKFPAFSDKFPIWASQSLAMQQYLTWTALELEGAGANLQHYNPLIDGDVQNEWNVPADWILDAQLVFGGKGGEAGEKAFKPVEERVKVFGA